MRDYVILAADFRLRSIFALSALPVPIFNVIALLPYHLQVLIAPHQLLNLPLRVLSLLPLELLPPDPLHEHQLMIPQLHPHALPHTRGAALTSLGGGGAVLACAGKDTLLRFTCEAPVEVEDQGEEGEEEGEEQGGAVGGVQGSQEVQGADRI